MKFSGAIVRNLLEAVEGAFGADGLASVVAALPEEIRAQVEPMVVASRTFDDDVFAAIHAAVRDVIGGGSVDANRRVGRFAASIDFGGALRSLLDAPDFAALRSGLAVAWRRYVPRGHIAWKVLGPGSAHAHVQGAEGFTEPMWISICGRVEEMFRIGGAASASVELVSWSHEECVTAVTWTMAG